ncbi:MAG: ACT domain-containing protein, partial [Gemmatimonadaceae bacterium]
LLDGELSRSINVTGGLDDWASWQPALLLTRRLAAVASARLADHGHRAVESVTLRVGPDFQAARGALLASAAVGALEGAVEHHRLNLINARAVAATRGVELSLAEGDDAPHSRAIEVRVRAEGEELRVGGIAAADAPPRITRVGPYQVDVAARGTMIVLTNHDVPGVIGRVGTALGDAQVNIAEYHQARLAQGGEALAVISVDGQVTAEARTILTALPDVLSATIVRFGD